MTRKRGICSGDEHHKLVTRFGVIRRV